jgi:hypothetical protein
VLFVGKFMVHKIEQEVIFVLSVGQVCHILGEINKFSPKSLVILSLKLKKYIFFFFCLEFLNMYYFRNKLTKRQINKIFILENKILILENEITKN